MPTAEALAGVTCVAATGVSVGALVVLHILPTGLSPMHNAVSQYGISRYRIGYRVQTIALGVAGGAVALGLPAAAPGRARGLIALVVVFSMARLVISWFPMDEPGGERTNHGSAHGLIAIVTFLTITISAARLGVVAKQVPGWAGLATGSNVIAWLMVAALLAMMTVGRGARMSGKSPRYFGAIERAFYVAMVVWFVLVGVALT